MRSLPTEPARAALTPCSVLLTPTWEPGATAVSSSFMQGCVTTLVSRCPREGRPTEGAAVLQSGDMQTAGFRALRDPRKGGANTLLWEPLAVGEAGFCLLPLRTEALCTFKLSSHEKQ